MEWRGGAGVLGTARWLEEIQAVWLHLHSKQLTSTFLVFYISTISRDLLVHQIFDFTETTFQTYAMHRCVHTAHTGKHPIE